LKEAYAVRRTVPPSAEIEEQIERLLAVGVGENPREALSELARLGAGLIIQRAIEDEFDAWLGRARYERRPDYRRGLRNYESGLRNGFRPRKVQTAEGELEACSTKVLRTEPLRAMGDRRVRQGTVDARHRVVVRERRAGEAVQVDRLANLQQQRDATQPCAHCSYGRRPDADRPRAACCFAMGEQPSEQADAAQLVLVPSESLSRNSSRRPQSVRERERCPVGHVLLAVADEGPGGSVELADGAAGGWSYGAPSRGRNDGAENGVDRQSTGCARGGVWALGQDVVPLGARQRPPGDLAGATRP
jgi:hypothetical protein